MANEIRTSFLIEFTKQLAKSYLSMTKPKSVKQIMPTFEPRGQISTVQEIEHTEYEKLGPREIKSIREIEPYDTTTKRVEYLGLSPSIKANDRLEPLLQESSELKPLRELLMDQTIENIECSGADRNIVIKKRGKIIETDKQLKKEEIDTIIKAFSSRSDVKAEEGILRTKIDNLKIIVVLSKYAGNRFVITTNH